MKYAVSYFLFFSFFSFLITSALYDGAFERLTEYLYLKEKFLNSPVFIKYQCYDVSHESHLCKIGTTHITIDSLMPRSRGFIAIHPSKTRLLVNALIINWLTDLIIWSWSRRELMTTAGRENTRKVCDASGSFNSAGLWWWGLVEADGLPHAHLLHALWMLRSVSVSLCSRHEPCFVCLTWILTGKWFTVGQ